MRFRSEPAHVADVDMTPMIDIVFQLIAFFMVITNFEQTQADERVKLPRDQLAKPAKIKRQNDLVLNVGFRRDSTGRELSDAILFYAGEEIPILQSAATLERERRIFESLEIDIQSVTVVIRADAEVSTGFVQELIRFAQEAGFERFAIKATQEQ